MSVLLVGSLVGFAGLALFYFLPVSFSNQQMIKVTSLPQQRLPVGSHHLFPLILEPQNTVTLKEWTDWLNQHSQDTIESLLNQHQAILFRNFPISNAFDFHEMVEVTGLPAMDYIGGAAVRKQFTSRVVSSNESPPTEVIPFHHEMAQTPHPPTHSKKISINTSLNFILVIVFFFGEVVAETGGETPILSSTELYQRLLSEIPDFIRAIEEQGVKYIRTMYVIRTSFKFQIKFEGPSTTTHLRP